MYYVYILKGTRYYVGYTENLKRRLEGHRRGKTYSTKRIGSFELVGYYEKELKSDAMSLERMMKKSGHIERRINEKDFIRVEQPR